MKITDFGDFVNDSLSIDFLRDTKITEKREIIDEIAMIENGIRDVIELLSIDMSNKQDNPELYSDILYSINRISYFLGVLKYSIHLYCPGEY
ncbi:hypothetical protein R3G59_004704 [Salmonella enterica]|nr:hypothetical protein [Salmonella enterica]